jgi:hypothetical protein
MARPAVAWAIIWVMSGSCLGHVWIMSGSCLGHAQRGVSMSIRVVLAIGFDPWWFEGQRRSWQLSGNFVTSVGTTAEAIRQFRDGDFDAVLLGRSLLRKTKERIIEWIRSTGSTVPVLCVVEPTSACAMCEFGMTNGEPSMLLRRIGELLDQQTVSTAELAAAQFRGPRRPASAGPGVPRRAAFSGPVAEPCQNPDALHARFPGDRSPCFAIRLRPSSGGSKEVAAVEPLRTQARRVARAS